MELLFIALIAALVFGLCWLVDKGFTRIFRSKAQHRSGRSVRPGKHYATVGILAAVLGIGAILSGITEGRLLIAGGVLILLVGVGLVAYYLSTGIYYDDDSFLYCGLGTGSRSYFYNQIRHQQLYVIQGGSTVVELHMTDGTAVQVQSNMDGWDKFLDTAFLGWVRQKNIDMREQGGFHDPANSQWFPSGEEV